MRYPFSLKPLAISSGQSTYLVEVHVVQGEREMASGNKSLIAGGIPSNNEANSSEYDLDAKP